MPKILAVTAGLCRGHRAPGRARRRGDHPRLYRDHAAGAAGGQRRAVVRYHHPACAGRGGRGTGLTPPAMRRGISPRPALPAR
ncbi:hypothetical protein G6F66_015560 [Rhizopus arrhizus]|nr:hypothetical protein G6F66_015560 [Rhizopus arrhizus]